MKKQVGVRLGTVFFLVVMAVIISATGTYFYVSSLVNDIGRSQQMYLSLSNVEQIVVQNYVKSIDSSIGYDNIQNGIIAGYINGLGDGYSYYLDKKNYKASSVVHASAVDGGIHATFDKATECISVLAVKKNSPAYNAGIKTNDVILSIDGISVTESGYKASLQKLFCDVGNKRTVSVLRGGSSDLLTLVLEYSEYESSTVDYSILESGYGYIGINEFDTTTRNAFSSAYNTLVTENAVDGIIIDLRNNADGNYDSMMQVADMIMPAATICTRKQSSSADSQLYVSDASSLSVPFVVLQNSATAGAAEVLTSALIDNSIAPVVGEQSAGVGLGQREFALSNGTAIVLSVYEYITPAGNVIDGAGVIPSYEIHLENGVTFENATYANDLQLRNAESQLSVLLGNAE